MTDSDFRSAFYAHKDVLYRFVYRMTDSADDAEEVVQECFLALWRKPEAYDPNRGTLRAFLFGIARKLVLKRWRDRHPHDSLEEDSSTLWAGGLVRSGAWPEDRPGGSDAAALAARSDHPG
jgi:RNA polymerase sigma factor (sigma-70 family)